MNSIQSPGLKPVLFKSSVRHPITTKTNVYFGNEDEVHRDTEAEPPSKPKRGWVKRISHGIQYTLMGTMGLGTILVAALLDHNRPGQYSLVFDSARGGFQETVHGPGRVLLPLHKLIPIYEVDNVNVDATEQSVVEIFRPQTIEGKNIPRLGVVVDWEIADPENQLFELFTTKLGGERTMPPSSPETIFVKNGDPIAQRIYNQIIRPLLRGGVNDLATTVKAENFHTTPEFLAEALNEGLKDRVVTKLDGESTRTLNVASLQEQVGPLLKIHGVRVIEISLPKDLETLLEERARKPIDREIAILQEATNVDLAARDREQAKIEAIRNEITAEQEARLAELVALGQAKVAEIDAVTAEISAEGLADRDIIKATADRDNITIRATADERAAEILRDAGITAAQITSAADAGVILAEGQARALAEKLVGTPMDLYGTQLLRIQAIDGSKEALLALAQNGDADIRFIDPKTELKIEILSLNGANGILPGDVAKHIVGERAAHDEAELETDKPVKTD